MALDPEELKRLRQQRQERRARQKARRKLLFVRLGIAAAVLLLCLIVILVVIGQSKPKQPEATTLPESTRLPGETAEETDPAASSTIRFAVAGDLNVTENVIASGGSNYDYTQSFLDVAHLLADADLAAVNFEGNLCGAPYGPGAAPSTLADALASSGVDFVQLANSYSINKGLSGLASTIDAIRAAGMEPLGAYGSAQEASRRKGYAIREVGGIRVGVVAFTKGMDGMTLPSDGEGCVNLLYTDYDSTYQSIDTAGITAVLDALQEEKPDVVIALLHWGSEFNDTISKSQQSIVELLQSRGVSAIIGTHSHYVQKMDYDPQGGSFVAYSLGDFFGDASRAGSEYSVILELEITKDNETGTTGITGYSYTPIFTVAEKDKPLRVVRIRQAMEAFENRYLDAVSQSTYDAMEYALERIEARVTGK